MPPWAETRMLRLPECFTLSSSCASCPQGIPCQPGRSAIVPVSKSPLTTRSSAGRPRAAPTMNRMASRTWVVIFTPSRESLDFGMAHLAVAVHLVDVEGLVRVRPVPTLLDCERDQVPRAPLIGMLLAVERNLADVALRRATNEHGASQVPLLAKRRRGRISAFRAYPDRARPRRVAVGLEDAHIIPIARRGRHVQFVRQRELH